MALIQDFFSTVVATHRTGNATEHSYRPALQKLFDGLEPGRVSALNEPQREHVGAPDFSISRNGIVLGHCEAKDLHIDLHKMRDANLAQQKRYVGGLQNLLYTNCLEWVWYRDGAAIGEPIRIGTIASGILKPDPHRFPALEQMLRTFIQQTPQTITSSRALAERMAGKAILIKDILANSLIQDQDGQTELTEQYNAFKSYLIHDISIAEFADIYAETVTYGMFAARLHDTTLDTFNRQEALELLPRSNPFLRSLFGYIAGPNLDQRISWIIDDLAVVFRASNVAALMRTFGTATQRNDPFLHFYEEFLKAYNPEKRDVRGVWYTPEPVVQFIVRAVDDVLKNDFGLSEGLADSSTVEIDWDTGQRGLTKRNKLSKRADTVKERRTVHRVQLLDPATGTGTFLAEVIKRVAPQVQAQAPGAWADYVERNLIPRMHGFELLMASYAMCHLKLDMVLRAHGYEPTANPPRVSVFLTNSLEEGDPPNQTLPFAGWFSTEIRAANAIKRDMPIMCVIGNPPYNNSSPNKGKWIGKLIQDYKRDLNQRKINLDDDYIKFIRLAQHFIEKSGAGVVALITNNSFLDGTTHRRMREILLRTFDTVTVLNLHGDIRAKTDHPNDANVFDITQGVAITVLVKTSASQEAAKLSYFEILGSRAKKYEALRALERSDARFQALTPKAPYFFFLPRAEDPGAKGFKIDEIFGTLSSGIQTKNDAVAIQWDAASRDSIVSDFCRLDLPTLQGRYPDKKNWKARLAQEDLRSGKFERRDILYRVLDTRKTVLTQKSGGFLGRPRYEVMRHMQPGNIGLVVNKKFVGKDFSHVFVSTDIICHGTLYLGNRGQDFLCPLYLYPTDELEGARRSNLDEAIFARVQEIATSSTKAAPDELDVFDYIYGVLHCPDYREARRESLRVDFPIIPWPHTSDEFWAVSGKGRELRTLHLLGKATTPGEHFRFEGAGSQNVDKFEYRDGAVWINASQRFEGVDTACWQTFIGGYQVAETWLKQRKGRVLTYEDVQHYRKILWVLSETDRIMRTIKMTLE